MAIVHPCDLGVDKLIGGDGDGEVARVVELCTDWGCGWGGRGRGWTASAAVGT